MDKRTKPVCDFSFILPLNKNDYSETIVINHNYYSKIKVEPDNQFLVSLIYSLKVNSKFREEDHVKL